MFDLAFASLAHRAAADRTRARVYTRAASSLSLWRVLNVQERFPEVVGRTMRSAATPRHSLSTRAA